MPRSGIDAIDSGVTPCIVLQIPQHVSGESFWDYPSYHGDPGQYILEVLGSEGGVYREPWVGALLRCGNVRSECRRPTVPTASVIGFVANDGPIPFAAEPVSKPPISGGWLAQES